MKKFQFRLQKFLEYREAREKEIKNELAKLVSIQNLERARQDDIRKGISEQQKIFREKMLRHRFSSAESILFEKYVDVSHRAIEALQDKIIAMEPEIQKVRIRLIEASKDRKIVEKLREHKLEEYNYEMNRQIAKENDDSNQKIYAKRLAAGAEL